MNAIYTKDGQMATAWLPQRETGMLDPDKQDLIRFVVTAIRIHSWVNVTLGRVQLRTISALMTGPFKSPELAGVPPQPFRDDDMVYPAGDQSFWESVHVIGDSENDAIDDLDSKFLRSGLWHSALLAGGTLVGYADRLYVVPHDALDALATQIKSTGAEAFLKHDSFVDPTLAQTNAQGVIAELDQGSIEGGQSLPGKLSSSSSRIKLTIDGIPSKRAVVSGTVTFSDGVTATWMLDSHGRLALNSENKSHRPKSEDIQEFQKALQHELKGRGF